MAAVAEVLNKMVSNLYAGLSSFHLVLTDTNIPDSRQHGAGHLQWISNGLRGQLFNHSIYPDPALCWGIYRLCVDRILNKQEVV